MNELELKASSTVKEAMEQGHNCCEAVLLASRAVWDLTLPDEVLAAASLFGEGMGSGCSCGALVGMIMVSGILNNKKAHPLGSKLPQIFNERFKQEFGATCCRVIRKNRPPWKKIGRSGCIDLTSKTAQMLVEEWGGYLNAGTTENISNSTHS